MYICQRRIRRPETYLAGFDPNSSICIGVAVAGKEAALTRCGFSVGIPIGEQAVPAQILGPVSKYNSEGKYIKRRDLPMETVYREHEWHLTDYRGGEHSGVSYIPYQRYQREFISPPLCEVTMDRQHFVGQFL